MSEGARVGAILALGASGMIGQVVAWRELLALYQGNELTTGIILANWLLAESAGAWLLGRRSAERWRPYAVFAHLTALYAVALVFAVGLARLLRPLLGIPLGQWVGTPFAIASSMSVLAPVAFLHGALFPTAGRLYAMGAAHEVSVGRLYVWESLGALLGGIFTKLHFWWGGDSVQLTSLVWILSGGVLFVGSYIAPRPEEHRAFRVLTRLVCLGAISMVAAAEPLHKWLLAGQFRPYPLLGHASSPYASWAVLGADEQRIFVADGQPVYLTPMPDRARIEATAHIPILLHGSCRRVALAGGGLGGLLAEILKHSTVERVEYAELDPAVLALFRRFASEFAARELDDPRVVVHRADGRRFLQESSATFDIVWIGAGEPITLHQNRYFTLDFFQSVRRRLAPDGVLVLSLPGRMALPTPEQRSLHACVYETLSRVMKFVRVLPDDGHFLYLASSQRDLRFFTAEDFVNELSRRLGTDSVSALWPLERRLHPGWIGWFEKEFLATDVAPNRDLHPRALFHAIGDQQAVLTPRIALLLRAFQQRAGTVMAGALALALVLWGGIALRTGRRPKPSSVLPSVVTTGFAGMTMDLLIILAFQSALGYVHVWIGLLVAAYMIGAALGAACVTRRMGQGGRSATWVWCHDLSLCVFCAVLPWLLGGISRLSAFAPSVGIAAFLVANFVAGALTGMLFPLAAAWRIAHGETAGRAAGVLQAADLMGGWSAGLVVVVFLLPLAGLGGLCAILAALKGLSSTHVWLIVKQTAHVRR